MPASAQRRLSASEWWPVNATMNGLRGPIVRDRGAQQFPRPQKEREDDSFFLAEQAQRPWEERRPPGSRPAEQQGPHAEGEGQHPLHVVGVVDGLVLDRMQDEEQRRPEGPHAVPQEALRPQEHEGRVRQVQEDVDRVIAERPGAP